MDTDTDRLVWLEQCFADGDYGRLHGPNERRAMEDEYRGLVAKTGHEVPGWLRGILE